jgi:NAD(P)H-dependent FMN reductase
MLAPSMQDIAIIVGSARPERHAPAVAPWVHGIAAKRGDATFALAAKDHTKIRARRIAGFDGFVFVTPEYNHSLQAALENAIDFIFAGWNNKAAAIVSYGSRRSEGRRTSALCPRPRSKSPTVRSCSRCSPISRP